MRIISTLLLLCITILLHAQNHDSSQLLFTGNCYGTTQSNQLTKGLTGKVAGLNIAVPPADTSKQKIFIRCGYAKRMGPYPLLIIDGAVQKLSYLGGMNPNDIASIEILKSSAALAIYGSGGENGVIIVTTKKTSTGDLIIKDAADGKAIAGATVSFISANKKDTMMYVADEKGVVKMETSHTIQEGEMTVSAVGYKSYQQPIGKNSMAGNVIVLSPDIKSSGEVIISAIVCHRVCRRVYCISRVTAGCDLTKGKDSTLGKSSLQIQNRPTIYPSVLARGNSFHISLKEEQTEPSLVRLFSLNGNLVLQQNIVKGSVLQTVLTDPRWAAGVNFVQWVYANGRVAASERIIIQ